MEGGRNKCQVPAEARKGSRKESLLADSGFPEGQYWLGDSPTPEALERLGGAVSAGPTHLPPVARLFGLAEVKNTVCP